MVFGFLLTFFSASALAQDCDAAALSSDLADFSAQMQSSTSASAVLDEVTVWLAASQGACANSTQPIQVASEPGAPKEPVLAFSSAQDGNQPVLGPVTIPDGVYRIRLVTDGFFSAELEELEGTCDLSTTFGFFNIMMDAASGGAEVLFVSSGCEALITTSNVTKAWTLDFYQLGPDDVKPVKAEYSSEIDGSMPLLGPLQFEDGRYKITLVTDGFMSASIETVNGDCEISGFMGLFNIMADQASDGAQALLTTKECIGLITMSNVTEDWTLTFELIK